MVGSSEKSTDLLGTDLIELIESSRTGGEWIECIEDQSAQPVGVPFGSASIEGADLVATSLESGFIDLLAVEGIDDGLDALRQLCRGDLFDDPALMTARLDFCWMSGGRFPVHGQVLGCQVLGSQMGSSRQADRIMIRSQFPGGDDGDLLRRGGQP